ncbi:hypothetical protein N7462_001340 [Penicillium macrosclerotiorum]|uniref:uncharacterized protein n=1 Tax=Penicillium macrosclerotiorum TaxID=303699 RepID=UPI0025489AF2|nr:uncharacterized protein N7462_001340 [Penicillium macrosclerotiorum]KAJ5691917.1 hypothetical protein N7462_001340 [Penicillium macrosclerotiorum]
MTSQVAIANNLNAEHLMSLQRSLQQILSTELAEITLAQVVDGIPIEQIDTRWMFAYDPVVSGRKTPTDEAFRELVRWKSTFQVEDLTITSTIPGFEEPEIIRPAPIPQNPTYLYHVEYTFYKQYPMGVADMVGYWVEYRLLGGVVLFDRSESENKIDQFLTFCLDDDESTPCPFPLTAERNAVRIYRDDTFDLHIFRDKYERNRPVYPTDRAQPARRIRLEDDPDALEMHLCWEERLKEIDQDSSSR